MTVLWSFSHDSFVKLHWKNIYEPQHDVYIKIVLLQGVV